MERWLLWIWAIKGLWEDMEAWDDLNAAVAGRDCNPVFNTWPTKDIDSHVFVRGRLPGKEGSGGRRVGWRG